MAAENEKTELTSLKNTQELQDPAKQGDEDGDAHTMTNFEAMMNLIKCTLGLGIIALPLAFKNAGLWVGFFGVLAVGAVSTHCMLLLVNTSRQLCERLDRKSFSYDEVAKAAFQVGPKPLMPFSKHARNAVNIFLLIGGVGGDTVVLLFIAETCQQLVEYYFDLNLDIQVWIFVSFISVLIFVFVRTLKHLARLSFVANVGVIIALVIILQHLVQGLPPASNYPIFNSWRTFVLFFGTAFFSFDGMLVVLPIENKLKHPEDFVGLTGVLNTSMVISTAIFAALGFYGYMKYGDDVADSITYNLPVGNWMYVFVKITFVFSVYAMYGLEFYAVIGICWPPVESRIVNETVKKYGEYPFRLMLIVFMYIMAASVPHFDLIVSLVGSLAMSMTNLVIPATLDLLVRWHGDLGRCYWRAVKNGVIIVIGCVVAISGTGVALMEIVRVFSEDGHD